MRRSHKIGIPIVWLLLILLRSLCVSAQPLVHLEPFSTGLSRPVAITNAGDGRLFVVEQTGKIRIIDAGGNLLTAPFLDLTSKISYASERGLLGLAFRPDYASSGYFYVDYTDPGGNTRVSRFSVSDTNIQTADTSSESFILGIDQPYSNHNGGDLHFGPDGYLYISTGDGGSGGDPQNHAQDTLSLLGKILRIDVSVADTYAIPVSNPFAGTGGPMDEIWAFGLRNPWRFSFDRLTGDMWIGDVGQSLWEEIEFQEASSGGGENYGWRCYEGNHDYNQSNCTAGSPYVFPVHEYSHSATGGCSVTGGVRYRGNDYPGMYGYYFFGDYCNDSLWSLHPDQDSWVKENHGYFSGIRITAFGEDARGELYAAALNEGIIYRITDTAMVDSICLVTDTSYTVSFSSVMVSDSSFNRSDTTRTASDTSYTVSHVSVSVAETSLTLDDSIYYVFDTTYSFTDTVFTLVNTLVSIRDTSFTLSDTLYTGIDTSFFIVDSACSAGLKTWTSSDTTFTVWDTSYTLTGLVYVADDTIYRLADSSFVVHDSAWHILDTIGVYTGDTSTVGLYKLRWPGNFRIYPVPAEDYLEILLPPDMADQGRTDQGPLNQSPFNPGTTRTLTIRDVHGRILLNAVVYENPFRIDVRALEPGIYFLGVVSGDKQGFLRFVKK